jgi:hypothetical protein
MYSVGAPLCNKILDSGRIFLSWLFSDAVSTGTINGSFVIIGCNRILNGKGKAIPVTGRESP